LALLFIFEDAFGRGLLDIIGRAIGSEVNCNGIENIVKGFKIADIFGGNKFVDRFFFFREVKRSKFAFNEFARSGYDEGIGYFSIFSAVWR
jgi:hypothetical protein